MELAHRVQSTLDFQTVFWMKHRAPTEQETISLMLIGSRTWIQEK